MQRIVFLIGCIALVSAPVSAQIDSFSQRGKAVQGIAGSGLTIAHPNLPINSKVKVTNTTTGKEVEATVVDRIVASSERIADVSRGVWDALGLSPDTDILLSISPPPRQRNPEPVPSDGLAGNPPSATQPAARTPSPPPSQSAGESRPQDNRPASNSDFYLTMKNIMKEVINESQSASPPSTQVITVYPPYPPQNLVNNQSVINDSVPLNTANPQVPAAQPSYVPLPNQGPALPPQYQAPPVQAAPQYRLPALPPQQYQVPALPPQYQVPALPPQRPALPAAPPKQDCNANPRPQPTKLQIIPRLPNPNGREIYNLQVGSFCDPIAANGLENRLRAAGFNVTREQYNTLHRVIVTGIPAAMVLSTAQRLEAMGIKQIWVK